MNKRLLATALIALAIPMASWADPIPGLFNTGTNSSNVALSGGNGVTDPHYVIQASTSSGFAGNNAVTYFNGAYQPDDGDSRWISLSSTGSPGSNTTTYRLTFNLTGFDPSTASISGSWGADNFASMLLNGVDTGNELTDPLNFMSLTSFTISSGFVSGINFLDLVVTDGGEPTAVRVDDLAGTAEATTNGSVPEPSTWAMMLLGFGAVGLVIRRTSKPVQAQLS